METATRSVLEALGIELHDIPDENCCPNQMTVQSSSVGVWYLLAARNLCMAEEMGLDILTLCNGCYDTLKTTNSWLKLNPRYRERINDILANFGQEFRGAIEVRNILQALHDDVGPVRIEQALVHPLEGVGCAPFVGCHVRRPMDKMGFEDPQEPRYLARLIRSLGGEIVRYPERNSCCGGGLSVARKEDANASSRRIMLSAVGAGAEVMVVNCPYCYSQFQGRKEEINDSFHDRLEVPVMYLTQLMGIAMGIEPEKLGIDALDQTSPERALLESVGSRDHASPHPMGEDTLAQMRICGRCQACLDDCPTAMTVPEFRPGEIMELVRRGDVDEAARREDIWYCMNCHECVEKCPQGYGMVRLMIALKNRASAMGIRPSVVERRLSSLRRSGYAFDDNGHERRPRTDEIHELIERGQRERFEL